MADQLGVGVMRVSSITMNELSGSGDGLLTRPDGVGVDERSVESLCRCTRSGGIGTPSSRCS